jgi:hypothetical protein
MLLNKKLLVSKYQSLISYININFTDRYVFNPPAFDYYNYHIFYKIIGVDLSFDSLLPVIHRPSSCQSEIGGQLSQARAREISARTLIQGTAEAFDKAYKGEGLTGVHVVGK